MSRDNRDWQMYTREVEADQEQRHCKRPYCACGRPPLRHRYDDKKRQDEFKCGSDHEWSVKRRNR